MEKVLIIANHIDWVYSLRKELIEELSEIYKVIVCIPDCESSFKLGYFKSINVDFIFINFNGRGKNPFQDIVVFIKYFNVIRDLDPDIILTYTIKPNIYGSIASRLLKKKTIINVTGLGTGFYSNKVIKFVVKKLYSIGCKASYHVFFQNTDNMNLFIDGKMVKKNKCSLLPGSGVNIEKYKPIDKSRNDNIIRFLYISRIMKEKGIEEYLNVADAITRKYPSAEFQILGPFEDEHYRDIIAEKRNKRIIYLGKSDDVRNEIREVDCIVHPTFYPEGMSNVLLEGGAMGKPLIASNIPGCKEIIDNGINGYLFEPRNVEQLRGRIETFIKLSEDERKRMGQRARDKISKEFDRQIVIDAYLREIENSFRE